MKKLSAKEEKMLNRYQRSSITVDTYTLLRTSALSSNKLMRVVEDTFTTQELSSTDYMFLKMLSERKAKNFKILAGVDAAIAVFTKLKEASFLEIKIKETQ